MFAAKLTLCSLQECLSSSQHSLEGSNTVIHQFFILVTVKHDDVDFFENLYSQLSIAANNLLIDFIIKTIAVVCVDDLVQIAPQYLIRNLNIILRERSTK